jgi:hypothetical protein
MNEDLTSQVRALSVIIHAARQMGAHVEAYDRLIDLSALMVSAGKTTEAANLLAFLLHQTDMPYDLYDRADDLWLDLESSLCPRVITDAKADAVFMTLRGAIEAALVAMLPSDSSDAPSQ